MSQVVSLKTFMGAAQENWGRRRKNGKSRGRHRAAGGRLGLFTRKEKTGEEDIGGIALLGGRLQQFFTLHSFRMLEKGGIAG